MNRKGVDVLFPVRTWHWLIGRRASWGVIVCSFFIAFGSVAWSAEFSRSGNKSCVIIISGTINIGDFERFLPFAQRNFPGSDGESTSPNTVCLDSQGGNLTEALKFAAYFYHDGVGTVVDDGQRCLSACAIMFMMGVANGDELGFINRKLHIGGTLGFHRPSLTLPPAANFDARSVVQSFDLERLR